MPLGTVAFIRQDLKLRNLITNWDFSKGVEFLAVLNAQIDISPNQTIILTSTGGNARVVDADGREKDKKYYVRCKIRALDSDITRLNLVADNKDYSMISNPEIGTWYEYSRVVDITSNSSVGAGGAGHTGPAGSQSEVDYIFAIDLTEVFGRGNEPTVTEMDVLLELLGGGFGGTLSLTSRTLANWLLKLIRQNTLAIVAGGGTNV